MPLVTLEGIHFELGWEIPPEKGATQKKYPTHRLQLQPDNTRSQSKQRACQQWTGGAEARGGGPPHTGCRDPRPPSGGPRGRAAARCCCAPAPCPPGGPPQPPSRAAPPVPGQCLPSFLHSAQPFGQEEVLKGRPSKGQKSLPLMDHSVCAAPGWATFDPTEVKLSDRYPNCWLTASQWHGRERHTTQKIHWTPSKY